MGSNVNKPSPVLMEYEKTPWQLQKEKIRYQKQGWYVDEGCVEEWSGPIATTTKNHSSV